MGKIFGTDGIRGIANTGLTCELAMKLGRAAASVLGGENGRPKVLIGKDTRASGDMLEAALTAGLCSVGADVISVGVVPTPAVAYLVQKYGCDAGAMISASHNPCEYNGIKLFSGDGYKLPDSTEEKIEQLLEGDIEFDCPTHGNVGRVTVGEDALADYIEYISDTTDCRFDGMKIGLDCSNGSASDSAKVLFEMLGAEVYCVADRPNGVNINDNCGSTHIENIAAVVREQGLDLGFAFDGDADRCLAVDGDGNLVDGDKLIAINAVDMKSRGRLNKNKAVVTVMSNMGFFRSMQDNNIDNAITKVGDRYVLEEMVRDDLSIGGEQSGHIIFLDYATTGDGQLSAVQTLSAVKRSGKSLAQLAEVMTVYPQVLINITVSDSKKAELFTDSEIAAAIKSAEQTLGDDGRVLVRASGTEPLVRVMLEGKELALIERLGNEISDVVAERLCGTVKR